MNIAKILRLPFLKISANGCFLAVLMVHSFLGLKVQGLDCMTASVSLQGPCHRSSLLFLNRHQ